MARAAAQSAMDKLQAVGSSCVVGFRPFLVPAYYLTTVPDIIPDFYLTRGHVVCKHEPGHAAAVLHHIRSHRTLPVVGAVLIYRDPPGQTAGGLAGWGGGHETGGFCPSVSVSFRASGRRTPPLWATGIYTYIFTHIGTPRGN